MPWRRHSRIRSYPSARREAITTGLLGAGVVALFYLFIDAVRGYPLMTPGVLGDVLMLHRPILIPPDFEAIAAYSVVHVLAFIVFARFLVALVRAAEDTAVARYALVQFLVVFELFFYGLLSVVSEEARGLFPFIGVLAANSLALITMMGWLWRHHPVMRLGFTKEPLGASDRAPSPAMASRRY